MEWEKCNKSIVYPHASCFYQARIFKKGEDDIYADIVQYDCIGNLPQSWELDIQIPEGFSITGKQSMLKVLSTRNLITRGWRKTLKN